MEKRIAEHQKIRDDIVEVLKKHEGVKTRVTDGGSYLFTELPQLEIPMSDFVKLLREYANVTVTPGTEFGKQFTHHFRINFFPGSRCSCCGNGACDGNDGKV